MISFAVYAELCAVSYQLSCAVQSLVSAVKHLADDPESKQRNRIGVLLGTRQAQATKTLTHVMWVLFNVLPAGSTQKPHRHTPTALDFAISAPSKGAAHRLLPQSPGTMLHVLAVCTVAACQYSVQASNEVESLLLFLGLAGPTFITRFWRIHKVMNSSRTQCPTLGLLVSANLGLTLAEEQTSHLM